MGAFDLCALAPLAGLPVDGEQLREVLDHELTDYYAARIGSL
jgi:hypothetical protein